MNDPRQAKLADILVNYSTAVQPGDWVQIEAGRIAVPLVRQVVAQVLKAGGRPSVNLLSDQIDEQFLNHADQEQLAWVSPTEMLVIKQANVTIFIEAPENTRALSGVDPQRQKQRQAAYREWSDIYSKRAADGELRWVLTSFPCPALAQEADMSLVDFEAFVYAATFADRPDPVHEWQQIRERQQYLVDWLAGKETVTIRGRHADLTMSISGRTFVNSAGNENMPSGEIFTGPVEESVRGWVDFTYPAVSFGREVAGVHLEFRDGRVVKATADKNEALLLEILDTDPGARFLGELGIGTNDGIRQFTKNILYDEKISGTFHLAIGNGYPETGSVNQSSVHWDFICDARQDTEILVDGEPFFRNGRFLI